MTEQTASILKPAPPQELYDRLFDKIRRIKPTALSEEELLSFIEEAAVKTYEDSYDQNSSAYREDVLLYYVLSQLSLFSGDLAEYSNYCLLYNNAAQNFHRLSFEQAPCFDSRHFFHLW